MTNEPLNDPLDKEYLVRDDAYWKTVNANNLSFLSSVYNLAKYSDYFILARPVGNNWGDGYSSLVEVEEFANGTLKGAMGLWLNDGGSSPEPLARWTGSTFPKQQLLQKDLIAMRQMGSIVMSPYYMSQIDKEIEAYFKAKEKLMISNPSHPALQYAPKSREDVNKAELLWLQFWNIAMQRRSARSFSVKNNKINYSQRIPLTTMPISLDKKVLFSELNMFNGEDIVQHASLPNEWICNIYDKQTNFINRDMWWAMPETPPKY
jgi:hypothetical protein